jgi:hypothetical protein
MYVCSSQKALSLLFRILTVFASVAEELKDGHDAHEQIIQCGVVSLMSLWEIAFVDMYAKCGSMGDAQ